MLIKASFVLLCCGASTFGATVAVKHLLVGTGSRLFVSTATPPDAGTIAILTDRAHLEGWKVSARHSPQSSNIGIQVKSVTWFDKSQTFEIDYDPRLLGWRDPHHYGWTVEYTDPANGVKASIDPPTGGFLQAAKAKDDANLYLAGTYLAGESTKPIYTIDAKLGWVPEIRESGYFFGFEATAQVNAGSTPPVDRTRVDPDALAAGANLHFMRGPVVFNWYPARGEFSRKNPESNFVPAGTIKWIMDPLYERGRSAFVFYPSIGLEGGWNLNKPSKMFKQPVDFSKYNHIFRGVTGGYAAYYVRRTKPVPGDPYAFEASMTYIGRILATNEPFVTSQYVSGQRQPLVTLDDKVRHHLEGVIQWNVSTFVGLQAKYTYGSLPPLFQFTDHQVTLGVTFKAKLPGHL